VRSDAAIPAAQLQAVVLAIYEDADAANWLTLSPQDRSGWYGRWVNDPRVGGILKRFLTPEAARSWIKDGPMKEYANATRGTGRYAAFGRTGGTGPSEIAVAVLGSDAAVDPESVGVKPPHCEATNADGTRSYLAWGAPSNFRNLLWAALRASVLGGMAAHVIVLEPPGAKTAQATATEQAALAQRCGIGVHRMTERLGTRKLQHGSEGEV
jgi:hypothetical protein